MSGTRRTVLVIENEPDMRELVRLILSEAGYRVATAGDGAEGLSHITLEMPDLILLDLRMPGMDGWQFARKFREIYQHRCPVLLFTAVAPTLINFEEIEVDGVLPKPFAIDEFLLVIRTFLLPETTAPRTRLRLVPKTSRR